MIQLDQLAAVKMVFPMDADKLLQLLLATSRQVQEVFIRAYFFVDVVLDGRRDKRKPEFFRAVCRNGTSKVVPLKCTMTGKEAEKEKNCCKTSASSSGVSAKNCRVSQPFVVR